MSEQYNLTLSKEEKELLYKLVSAEYQQVQGQFVDRAAPTSMREFIEKLTDNFGSILYKLRDAELLESNEFCTCGHASNQHFNSQEFCHYKLCGCKNFYLDKDYQKETQKPDSNTVVKLAELRGQGGFALFSPLRNCYVKPTPCKTCGHGYSYHKVINIPSDQYCYDSDCVCENYCLDEEKAEVAK